MGQLNKNIVVMESGTPAWLFEVLHKQHAETKTKTQTKLPAA